MTHCGKSFLFAHLDAQRTRPLDLDHRDNHVADVPSSFGQKKFRRVEHVGKSCVSHLEQADFARRAESIFYRLQDAKIGVALALEEQHRVNNVFKKVRSGKRTVLCHVPDNERRHAQTFDSCISLAEHSRTCETLPGALSISER